MRDQVQGLCPTIPKHATTKELHSIAIEIIEAVEFFDSRINRLLKDAENYEARPLKYPFKSLYYFEHNLEISRACRSRMKSRYENLLDKVFTK